MNDAKQHRINLIAEYEKAKADYAKVRDNDPDKPMLLLRLRGLEDKFQSEKFKSFAEDEEVSMPRFKTD